MSNMRTVGASSSLQGLGRLLAWRSAARTARISQQLILFSARASVPPPGRAGRGRSRAVVPERRRARRRGRPIQWHIACVRLFPHQEHRLIVAVERRVHRLQRRRRQMALHRPRQAHEKFGHRIVDAMQRFEQVGNGLLRNRLRRCPGDKDDGVSQPADRPHQRRRVGVVGKVARPLALLRRRPSPPPPGSPGCARAAA